MLREWCHSCSAVLSDLLRLRRSECWLSHCTVAVSLYFGLWSLQSVHMLLLTSLLLDLGLVLQLLQHAVLRCAGSTVLC